MRTRLEELERMRLEILDRIDELARTYPRALRELANSLRIAASRLDSARRRQAERALRKVIA